MKDSKLPGTSMPTAMVSVGQLPSSVQPVSSDLKLNQPKIPQRLKQNLPEMPLAALKQERKFLQQPNRNMFSTTSIVTTPTPTFIPALLKPATT
jgi:hypothetical protein